MRRWTEGIVIVTVMVCFATACGGSGTLSLDPVASAATKTQRAGMFRTDIHGTITAQGHEITLAGAGVEDSSAGAAHLNLVISGLPAAAGASHMSMEEVIRQQTLYMRTPLFASKLPGGKHWVKINLRAAAQNAGLDLPGMSNGVDPSQGLDELLAAGSSRNVGTETVAGTPMTHYHVQVDPTRANRNLPPAERANARKAIARIMRTTGKQTIPVDAWVDGKGYVRRVTTSVSLGKQGSFSITADFRDFGTKARIATPAAGDTLDVTDELGSMPGG
jgi:hypothetical protein